MDDRMKERRWQSLFSADNRVNHPAAREASGTDRARGPTRYGNLGQAYPDQRT